MAKYLLIEDVTRVIKLTTIDPSYIAPVGHTLVLVADNFSWSGNDKKLSVDNTTEEQATQQELDTAYTPPYSIETLNLRDTAQILYVQAGVVKNDVALPADVRLMAQDLQDFLVSLRDYFKSKPAFY